jgi:hypothetical protein
LQFSARATGNAVTDTRRSPNSGYHGPPSSLIVANAVL